MDIFHMRCIVRAAETLNFSQTAKEMYITQSAVTQQIASVERELGVKLFRKKGRNMELTDAGRVFAAGLNTILTSYDALCAQVSRVNTMETELRIGYHGPMNWGTMLSLIQTYEKRCPGVALNIRTDHWGVLIHDLSQGMLDAVFTEKSEIRNYPQLEALNLFRDGACVCMSKENPLADKALLKPEELSGQRFIMTTSPRPSASMDAIIHRLHVCGIDMTQTHFVNQFETALTMAAANMGITFLPRSFNVYEYPSLVFIDLDMPDFFIDMVLAYRPQSQSQAQKEFIRLCSDWDFTDGES